MKHLPFGHVVVVLALATSAAQAGPGHSHKAEVEYRADGSVRVGNQAFATREAYHRSKLFRDSGARCGTRMVESMVKELIAPSDCNLGNTTINEDYNANRT